MPDGDRTPPPGRDTRPTDVLDHQSARPGDYWDRIMEATGRLDRRGPDWRLRVLVADTPDSAAELPTSSSTWASSASPLPVTRAAPTP